MHPNKFHARRLLVAVLMTVGIIYAGFAQSQSRPESPVLTALDGRQIHLYPNAHDITGLPLTPDGWTDLLAMYQNPDLYIDTRIIYVSSSQGSDSSGKWYSPTDSEVGDNPFMPAGSIRAFRTIAEGWKNIRDGKADILLLKRGDIWNESGFTMDFAGPSPMERIIISEYGAGAGRPEIRTGNGSGFRNDGGGKAANVIFAHLHLNSIGRTDDGGGTGFRPRGAPGDHFMIEGSLIQGFSNNITINPHEEIAHTVIRRNVIVDAHGTGSLSQGIYASTNTKYLLIEENVIDHNGWMPGINDPNTHNHNVYLNRGVYEPIVRRNIVTRASSHGTQLGRGGYAIENVYSHNPIVMNLHRDPNEAVTVRVLRNVMLNGVSMGSDRRAFAMSNGSRVKDGLIQGNVIAHADNVNNTPRTFVLGSLDSTYPSGTIRVLDNIVYNWGGRTFTLEASSRDIERLEISNNTFVNHASSHELVNLQGEQSSLGVIFAHGNRIDLSADSSSEVRAFGEFMSAAQWEGRIGGGSGNISGPIPAFPDPERRLAEYAGTIGLPASFEAFIAAARTQERANWNPDLSAVRIVNYVREGFGLEAIPE